MSGATTEFKQILVPTDFGTAAARALEVAVDLAKKYGARITVLHVYELPVYPYPEVGVLPDIDFVTPLREAAQKALAGFMSNAATTGCEVRAELECGIPWTEILAEAERSHADLIVMGTHGRKGMMHALLGSVAEKIVRMSKVPVLTIRQAEK